MGWSICSQSLAMTCEQSSGDAVCRFLGGRGCRHGPRGPKPAPLVEWPALPEPGHRRGGELMAGLPRWASPRLNAPLPQWPSPNGSLVGSVTRPAIASRASARAARVTLVPRAVAVLDPLQPALGDRVAELHRGGGRPGGTRSLLQPRPPQRSAILVRLSSSAPVLGHQRFRLVLVGRSAPLAVAVRGGPHQPAGVGDVAELFSEIGQRTRRW